MISGVFHDVIYLPIYNTLAFTVGVMPGHDIGIAIILVTLVFRLILSPLSMRAAHSQLEMQALDPQLKQLREKYKDDKEALGRETMALFKTHEVNPLAGILLLIIQLPLIIGLYSVFRTEAGTFTFDPTLLYSFVHTPESVSPVFLGLINLTGSSVLLAALVAVSQFFYARVLMPHPPAKSGEPGSFQQDLSQSMHVQMRYVFPLVLGVVAYAATSATALYFLVSNLFGLIQQVVVQRLHDNKKIANNVARANQ